MESDSRMPAISPAEQSALISETARRDALIPGTLVWFDSMTGSVPCRILSRDPRAYPFTGDRLSLRVTGGRHPAYPRGLVFETTPGPFVRARAALS